MTELERAAKEYEGIDPYYGDLESRAFIAGAKWVLEQAGLCLWIPISEGLPDNTIEFCEVTYNFANSWLIAMYPERKRVACASYKDGEFDVHTPLGSFKVSHAGGVVNIFAWRPLPKPYNENE